MHTLKEFDQAERTVSLNRVQLCLADYMDVNRDESKV